MRPPPEPEHRQWMRPSPAAPPAPQAAIGPADAGPPPDDPPQPSPQPPEQPITPAAPAAPPIRWAWPRIPSTMAGPAIGALIAGIAALPVALAVVISAAADNEVVAVAFMVLTVYLGGGAAGLATVANRQIRTGMGEYGGRGAALAGMICGGVAVGISVLLVLLVSLV